MSLRHVLTGGLGYAAPGVGLVPTWGLGNPAVGEPTTILLPASYEPTLALSASFGAADALGLLPASYETTLALTASLTMPERSDVVLWRGSDVDLIFTVPDDQDVTGLNIVFAMADRTPRIEKAATVNDAQTFTVSLVEADTIDLTAPKTYTFDAWVRASGGNVPLAYGSIELRPEVPT